MIRHTVFRAYEDGDWLASGMDEEGNYVYPFRIRVGSTSDPVIFVPERTCRNVALEDELFRCSECGNSLSVICEGHFSLFDEMDQIPGFDCCPFCGARVEEE